MTSNVTINNATLINNGSIIIGGIINGGGGTYVSGHSTGNYAQITLNSSIIDNYGSITTYGYINESGSESQINNKSTGSISAPFVVVENRGGSIFAGMYLNGLVSGGIQAAPFNRFYMPNIYPKIRTVYGGSIYGLADLYANEQHNTTTISLIGSSNSFLIRMYEDTVIETKTNYVSNINIYGDVKLNSLSISIKALGMNVNISTSEVFFPLSWYQNINLYKHEDNTASNVSFGTQKLKILPGSRLYIGDGVNVDASTIVVYDSSFDDVGKASTKYESYIGDGELIIDGNLDVDYLGGNIKTNGSTGKVVINNGASVASKELIDGSASSASYDAWTYNLKMKLSNGVSVNSYYTTCGTGTYYASNGGWYKFGNATVSYYTNYPIRSGVENEYVSTSSTYNTVNISGTSGGLINSNINTQVIPSSPNNYYTFGGWYLDEACNDSFTKYGRVIYGDITLFAKWIPNEYSVVYNITYPSSSGMSSADISNTNIDKYHMEIDDTSIKQPTITNSTYSEYTFVGWFSNSSFTTPVNNFSTSLISNNTINLYGYYVKDPVVTIDYDYANNSDLENYSVEKEIGTTLDDSGIWSTINAAVSKYTESETKYEKYWTGVFVDQNGDEVFGSTEIKSNMTIKPIWGTKYKLTIKESWLSNPNGTPLSVAYYSKTNTHIVDLSTISTTKSGYIYNRTEVTGGTLSDNKVTINKDTVINIVYDKIITLNIDVTLTNPTGTYIMSKYSYIESWSMIIDKCVENGSIISKPITSPSSNITIQAIEGVTITCNAKGSYSKGLISDRYNCTATVGINNNTKSQTGKNGTATINETFNNDSGGNSINVSVSFVGSQ
ncbi:MAG: InlB B-repeat-containing protein [Bacilli bacterium]|nr:InlB B-repeat-containing protein [Bacilli bacterium]